MSTTLDDLINDVRQQLQAYLQDQEQFVSLVNPLIADPTDKVVVVDDVETVSKGVVEVDDELMLVKFVDRLAGELLVRARGWANTTIAPHSVDAIIRVQPALPRSQAARHINDTLQAVFPDVFRKLSDTFDYVSTIAMYELPDDVGEVLTVKYSIIGPSQWWQPSANWEVDTNANTVAGVNGVFPSGKALWLADTPVPGQKVQVVYTAAPGILQAATDTLEGTAGLPASTRDLIVFGACARAIPALEAGRLQRSAVEQSARDQYVQGGDATALSRYFYGLYQARLAEEALKLQRLNPTTTRYGF